MSGPFISTGMLTNKGKQLPNIDNYLKLKIKDLTIHIIPLSTSKATNIVRGVGGFLKAFIPSIYHPSLTHIAIQLNFENCEDIAIIEYGQYFSEETDLKKKSIFISSSSSNQPRENKNENLYYYINKENKDKDKRDGARITIFTKNFLDHYLSEEYSDKYSSLSELVTDIIACQYYNKTLKEYNEAKHNISGFDYANIVYNNFHRVECEVENKIILEDLLKELKGEKWIAKKYNVVTHNCQNFGAEIIKILKAQRASEMYKVRINEKIVLPSCIISALWHNEKLSSVNTLGRIPIFGFFHDIAQNIKIGKKLDEMERNEK